MSVDNEYPSGQRPFSGPDMIDLLVKGHQPFICVKCLERFEAVLEAGMMARYEKVSSPVAATRTLFWNKLPDHGMVGKSTSL